MGFINVSYFQLLCFAKRNDRFLLGAVQRWIFAQPAKAAISARCEEMAGMSGSYRHHKEGDTTRYLINLISLKFN